MSAGFGSANEALDREPDIQPFGKQVRWIQPLSIRGKNLQGAQLARQRQLTPLPANRLRTRYLWKGQHSEQIVPVAPHLAAPPGNKGIGIRPGSHGFGDDAVQVSGIRWSQVPFPEPVA